MAIKISDMHDSQVCLQGKNKKIITELCEAWFSNSFRTVTVNRSEMRFDILLVDADEEKAKQFEEKYTQCKIEIAKSIKK